MRNLSLIFIFLIITISSCGDDYERIAITSYPDGTPMQVGVYKWKGNNHILIKEINYFPNGEIEIEGEYNDEGQKDGLWISWYNTGKKWLEENYKKGVRDGEFIEWYKSGEKSFEGEYKNGSPSGKWTFWDEDGNKTNQLEY